MTPSHTGTIICDTPESIQAFRLLALRGRLQLEVKGLRFRVPTAPAVRAACGSTQRSKVKLLEEYETWLRMKGILTK